MLKELIDLLREAKQEIPPWFEQRRREIDREQSYKSYGGGKGRGGGRGGGGYRGGGGGRSFGATDYRNEAGYNASSSRPAYSGGGGGGGGGSDNWW